MIVGGVFGGDRRLEQTLRDAYNGNWTQGDADVGVFSGSLKSVPIGMKHGLDVAAAALADVSMPVIEKVAPEAVTEWFEGQRRTAYQSMAETRPDPATMGIVGQMGHALSSVMTMGAMGAVAAPATGLSSLGLAAYAIGGLTGYDKYRELREQGVAEAEAFKSGMVTGATMGVGAALPPFVGGTIARQIGSGIGINVGLGMAERAGISEILKDSNPQIAKHYETLDRSAMLIDAVLGAAFPLGARLLPKGSATIGEMDTAMQGNRGVADQTRDPALQRTLDGIDSKLAADAEVTRQIVEEGRPPVLIEPPRGVMDNSLPNREVAEQTALAARAIDDLMVSESGISMRQAEQQIEVLARAFRETGENAVLTRGAEAEITESAVSTTKEIENVPSVGQGAGQSFVDKVLVPARNAVSEGNSIAIRLKNGETIHLVSFGDEGEGRIVAIDRGGDLVGDLSYTKGEAHNPDIHVEDKWRRLGVATRLYDLAELRGAAIPPFDMPGQVRTEMGQAFRKARESGTKVGAEDTAAKAKPEAEVKPEDILNMEARRIAEAEPNRVVVDQDGRQRSAKEVLDEADAVFQKEQQETNLYKVAVACAIGVGE